MQLSAEERLRVEQCVVAFEAQTGAQVVTAVVGKSDNYPEIPWQAFALGASVTALLLLMLDLARPDWVTGYRTLFDAVLILGAGVSLALITVRWHALARMFLHDMRAETEVMEHARLLFLRHEVFATPLRNGVLILVSIFERRVIILPDTGLQARITDAELRPVIARMTPLLADKNECEALCGCVIEVQALLLASGFRASGVDGAGLPNTVIEESGDDGQA